VLVVAFMVCCCVGVVGDWGLMCCGVDVLWGWCVGRLNRRLPEGHFTTVQVRTVLVSMLGPYHVNVYYLCYWLAYLSAPYFCWL